MTKIYFDVNGTSGVNAADGNYYNADPFNAELSGMALLDSAGEETGWTLDIVSPIAQSANTSNSSYDEVYFPLSVAQTARRLRDPVQPTAQMLISGLDDAKTYTLIVTGHSGIASTDTTVSANGVSGSYNARATKTTILTGIIPADGSITVDFGLIQTGSEYAPVSGFSLQDGAPDPIPLTVTGVNGDDTITNGGEILITLEDGTGSGYAVDIDGVDISSLITEESATEITLSGFDIYSLLLAYGPGVITVTDGANSDGRNVTVRPASGYSYVVLGSLAASGGRITAVPDLETGDTVEWGNVHGGAIYDVEVADDGTFVAGGSVTGFDVRAFSPTDGWGAIGTQTINGEPATLAFTAGPTAVQIGSSSGSLRLTSSLDAAVTTIVFVGVDMGDPSAGEALFENAAPLQDISALAGQSLTYPIDIELMAYSGEPLAPETAYTAWVRLEDAEGNKAYGAVEFTTLAVVPGAGILAPLLKPAALKLALRSAAKPLLRGD